MKNCVSIYVMKSHAFSLIKQGLVGDTPFNNLVDFPRVQKIWNILQFKQGLVEDTPFSNLVDFPNVQKIWNILQGLYNIIILSFWKYKYTHLYVHIHCVWWEV